MFYIIFYNVIRKSVDTLWMCILLLKTVYISFSRFSFMHNQHSFFLREREKDRQTDSASVSLLFMVWNLGILSLLFPEMTSCVPDWDPSFFLSFSSHLPPTSVFPLTPLSGSGSVIQKLYFQSSIPETSEAVMKLNTHLAGAKQCSNDTVFLTHNAFASGVC